MCRLTFAAFCGAFCGIQSGLCEFSLRTLGNFTQAIPEQVELSLVWGEIQIARRGVEQREQEDCDRQQEMCGKTSTTSLNLTVWSEFP
jgi:hypothetical protein